MITQSQINILKKIFIKIAQGLLDLILRPKAWLPISLKEKGKKEKVKSEKTDKKRKHNGRTWQSAD